MMKAISRQLSAFSLMFAVCVSASAVSNAGSTGAAFLEFGTGARSGAMGEANTAWADDVYGMYFNPSGIARIRRQEVGFFHNTLFSDLNYNYIGYIAPISRSSAWGASIQYVDLGEVDRTTVSSGIANTILGQASGSDASGSLTYARALTSKLDVGVTLKIIHEKLDQYSATAGAVDLGIKWNEPLQGLSLGASLSNLGTRLQFVREEEELPITLRLGAAYRSSNRRLGLVTDLVWVQDQDIEAKLGGEYWIWPEHIALRAGVNSAKDVGSGFTAGAAFHWNDLAIDYAYVPFGEIGDQNLVSLTYQFGPDRPPVDWTERPAKARRPDLAVTTGKVWVRAFEHRSTAEEFDWIGASTATVLGRDWRRAGVVADNDRNAEYVIEGDYWVENGRLKMAARLVRGGETLRFFAASGSVETPFEPWSRLRVEIGSELSRLGVLPPTF